MVELFYSTSVEKSDTGLTERQLKILNVYDWINLIMFICILGVALHNMVRYIRRVGSSTNKALLWFFYASVVILCIEEICDNILDLVKKGDFVYDFCNPGERSSK